MNPTSDRNPVHLRDEFIVIFVILVLAAGLMMVEDRIDDGIWLWVRVIFGIPIALFLPGYSLQSALFARKNDLTVVERFAISFGMSIAIFPVVVLVLDRLPWGITEWPILISLTIWILICYGFTRAVRGRLDTTERFTVAANFQGKASFSEIGGFGKSLIVAMGFCVALGALLGARIAIANQSGGDATAFYFVNPEYWSDEAHTTFELNRTTHVGIAIDNFEKQEEIFSVLAVLNGELIGITGPIGLKAGWDWEGTLEITPTQTGQNQEIKILLTREGDVDSYRELRLIVEILHE